MPRKSKRRAVIVAWLTRKLRLRLLHKTIRLYDDDDDSMEDCKDLAMAMCLRNAERSRYLHRSGRYKKSPKEERFATDLNDTNKKQEEDMNGDLNSSSDEDLPWLNDEEFLQKFRMLRKSFGIILNMIKDHPIFESKTKKMVPPEHQLMVFLKYIGTEGSGSSNANQMNTFGVGYGTTAFYKRRVTTALLSLRDQYVRWPNAEERREISKSIQKEYDFPHYVGIADGTLTPLAFEPETC
jgi:hypothetical protein